MPWTDRAQGIHNPTTCETVPKPQKTGLREQESSSSSTYVVDEDSAEVSNNVDDSEDKAAATEHSEV